MIVDRIFCFFLEVNWIYNDKIFIDFTISDYTQEQFYIYEYIYI